MGLVLKDVLKSSKGVVNCTHLVEIYVLNTFSIDREQFGGSLIID